MSDRKRDYEDLDRLLRRALADDLPADVAAGMREGIELFRAEKMKTVPAAAWAWLFRRGVWAALSILMLLAGILLQGARPSSPLADRIAEVKAGFSEISTIGR